MKINKNFIYDKKTKIIATLGPSSSSEEVLEELFSNGANVVRLNMSHGDFEEQGERIIMVRKVAKKLGIPISILLDTKGPEIRTFTFKYGKVDYKIGDKIFIESGKEIEGTSAGFAVTYKDLTKTVELGQEILCDDGKLSLTVDKIEGTKVLCTVNNNHAMKNKKAVNIPGANLTLPFVNDYDKKAIEWGLTQNIDYIASSFVNSAADVKQIKDILKKNKKENVQIISKIESLKAINDLNSIILESDGIMLARGDLGVEIPFEKVPFYQALITNKCKFFGKPIVIATQMLESMSDSPRPTRSETTDVYFAANSGVDSTMLSGETAAGHFPLEAVQSMSLINRQAELNYNYQSSFENAYAYVPSINAEIGYKVAKQSIQTRTDYIITLSQTGSLIKALSKFRPNARILGVSNDPSLETYFGIWYAVYMNIIKKDPRTLFEGSDLEVMAIAKKWGAVKGQEVIIAKADNYRKIIVK